MHTLFIVEAFSSQIAIFSGCGTLLLAF